MSRINPKILIVAPHSYCLDEQKQRHCDRRALKEANKLDAVARGAGYDVELIVSDMLRKTHDYNRKESYDTPWRQKIRDYIEGHADKPIIIYEVHSFPPVGTEFADGSQMAFLAIDEYYDQTKYLMEYIRHTTNIIVHSHINGTRQSNLMVDTSKYGNIKAHYLLEFNEDDGILTDGQSDLVLSKIFMASTYFANGILSTCKKNKYLFGWIIIAVLLFVVFYFSSQRKQSTRELSLGNWDARSL